MAFETIEFFYFGTTRAVLERGGVIDMAFCDRPEVPREQAFEAAQAEALAGHTPEPVLVVCAKADLLRWAADHSDLEIKDRNGNPCAPAAMSYLVGAADVATLPRHRLAPYFESKRHLYVVQVQSGPKQTMCGTHLTALIAQYGFTNVSCHETILWKGDRCSFGEHARSHYV